MRLDGKDTFSFGLRFQFHGRLASESAGKRPCPRGCHELSVARRPVIPGPHVSSTCTLRHTPPSTRKTSRLPRYWLLLSGDRSSGPPTSMAAAARIRRLASCCLSSPALSRTAPRHSRGQPVRPSLGSCSQAVRRNAAVGAEA
jgi:hypothetical protein